MPAWLRLALGRVEGCWLAHCKAVVTVASSPLEGMLRGTAYFSSLFGGPVSQ